MTRWTQHGAVAGLVLALSGCQFAAPFPDFRPGGGPAGPGTASPQPPWQQAEDARASDLCTIAAQERGLAVEGVASVQPVAAGREVMLDITRGGVTGALRCLYDAGTDEARLMLL